MGHTDGRLDRVVGQFGYDQGEVRWMENKGNWTFESHTVNTQSGTIHTPIADFDGDGKLDFAALISQEWEEVHLFRNRGEGGFQENVLWGAKSAETQRWLGRIAGRFREADDSWLEELRLFCFDPSQLAVWGKIDFEAKHGDRGKALFARALEVAPANPIGHEALGEWYLENGDVATALTFFTQAVQLPRPGLSLFVNLAATFRRLEEPAETLRAVQRGLAAIPEASELYYELGVAFDDLGRPQEAMAAYRTAIERSPNAAAAHVNLAVNLLKAGAKAEAYENLQLALKAQPTMPKALGMLGDLELAAGNQEAAARYIRPFYRFYPGLPRARRAMAQWHAVTGANAASSGRFEEAEQAFQEAIRIDPDSIDARGQLGILYGQKGRYQDALPQFEAVYKLQPADPRPAMFLGMAYAQLGRKEDARRLLREGEARAIAANRPEIAARCRELLLSLPQ